MGVDVLRCLGLTTGRGGAYAKLADDEMVKSPRMALGETNGGKPMVLVSKSGLYKLILRSDKPDARKFCPPRLCCSANTQLGRILEDTQPFSPRWHRLPPDGNRVNK